MTYIQAFEKIKERLQTADTQNFTFDFAIQVNLINKDCSGAFYISYIEGVFSVEPYDYRDNTALISIMLGDFTKLVEGKLNVDSAVESGAVELWGNIDAVKQLSGIVTPEKKAVEKKPAKKESKPVSKPKAEKPKKEVKEASPKKTSKTVKLDNTKKTK